MNISDMNKKAYENFLKWLICTLIAGTLAILASVVVIDPYNLYASSVFGGINAVKPELSRHIEEIKVTQAAKLNPDTLIFGNSRAEIGFDPESPSVIRRGFCAYNLAIRGTSIGTASQGFEYLLKKGIKPKRVVLALDFVDFMQVASSNSMEDEANIVEAEVFPVERWFWRFDSLFSMASIKDTVRTILIQGDEEAATMTARGFNPLREYLPMARNEGYFVLFRQRAEENAKIYLKKSAGKLDQNQFKIFRRMMESAVNAGSEITVVIYPYHAQILALFDETGLLPAFTNWKRQIVAEVSGLLNHQHGAQISIVDFSGYGPYQCEPIPGKDDHRSATRWYWEAGHFKKALGDVALERLLSSTTETQFKSQDQAVFGVKLNQANFNANLDRMDMEREQCEKANPQLFEEVKTLVQSLTTNDPKFIRH